MANNVPFHNQNHVDLAVLLEDPVGGADNGIKAATDGTKILSSERESALRQSYWWFVERCIDAYGLKVAAQMLEGNIGTQTLTFNGSAITLNKDFLTDLYLTNDSTSAVWQFHKVSQEYLDRRGGYGDADIYTIRGGSLYVYDKSSATGAYSLVSSGTGKLYYFRLERVDKDDGTYGTANAKVDDSDIGLNKQYHPACVAHAAYLIAIDHSTDEFWRNKAMLYQNILANRVPLAMRRMI